jgi:thiamine-monophosphate kinase
MKDEFEFINDLKARFSLDKVGDDCAVLPKNDKTDLLVTADLLVEDIDFHLEWTTPEFLGHKALAVSLSDIAAMGGTPKWALVSIGVPESLWKTDFLDRFFDGWHELARKHDVELVGGDVSRSPDKLVIDSVAGGEAPRGRAILRSGTRPGDAIFVTGFLGGAAAGLEWLKEGGELRESSTAAERHIALRQLQPLPQVQTAKLLQEYKLPTAVMDISDGLSSDLTHLCTASGVGARIYRVSVPIDPAIAGAMDTADGLELALHGGEDLELLLTVPQDKTPIALDLGFYQIGEITEHSGRIELIVDGDSTILEPKGYRHF